MAAAGTGSWLVARAREAPVLPERSPPATYRIDYEVTGDGTAGVQELLVRRPFDGRNVRDGGGLVTTVHRAWRLEPGGPVDLGRKAPSTAAGDARPRLALQRALDERLAAGAGSARVAGRRCDRYEVALPLGRELSPAGPLSRTRICVDDDGLVLEEVWRRGSSLARHRRALRVDLEPSLDGDPFREQVAGRRGEPSPSEPSIRTLHPGESHELRVDVAVPERFELEVTEVVEDGTPVLVDAWVDGIDVLLVEHVRANADPWPAGGFDVDTPSGRLTVDLVASRLVVDAGDGEWVRLSGTVSPEELERIGRGVGRNG